MPDYELLRIIWWLLLGILLIGYAITDGFDLGAAILLPFVARKDKERRIVINAIGPVWEGNQVWLVLGAGAIFAAWPAIYAVTFSGLYLAMFLALASLILRPVAIKYRSKIQQPTWRKTWDMILFGCGVVTTLVFGVAIGNVIQGIPFYFDGDLRMFYTGGLIALFNPFALVCGLLSIFMFTMHGGLYLGIKTEGQVRERSLFAARLSAIIFSLLFALAGLLVMSYVKGYMVTSMISHSGPSNPLYKTVVTAVGSWRHNFNLFPILWLIPGIGFLGAILTFFIARIATGIAFISSSLSLASAIGTFGVAMFPFILPSSENPNMSLLVWDASSSQTTLFIMLIATVIFMPLILIYTSWVYWVLRGKVTDKSLEQESNAY